MRILIVDTCYEPFLGALYGRRPELAQQSYDEQWRALMGTFFATADAYSHHLGLLGHPAHELVVNCAPLQAAWRREHRRRLPRALRRTSVLQDQVDWFAPDVVYVQNVHLFSPERLARLRRGGALVVGQIATTMPPWPTLEAYDLLVSSFPHYVEAFRGRGIASEYLPLAFDARVLGRLGGDRARSGAAFVGSLTPDTQWSANALLARAAELVPLEIWGLGAEGWPAGSALRRSWRGEAWGLEMYAVFASAKIVVNRHVDVSGDDANNMRLFEATGVGALLLTDEKRNLSSLFAPGREVVTYGTAEELADRVRHYLADEDERREIARAGQARTLAAHTYERRMPELVRILERAAA